MTDYSQYPYRRMLHYIEKRSKELGKSRDYVQYVLSMEQAESMEKLIDIYNHVFQLLAILFFETRKVPSGWYNPETWGYNNEYLLEELNCCLNENILRWFKRFDAPTNEQSLSALSNLRSSKNVRSIQKEILKVSTPEADKGVSTLLYNRERLDEMRNVRKYFSYNKYDYLYCSGYLAAHGHIFDIIEISFAKDHNISYDKLAEDYKKDYEREKRRQKEIEDKEKSEAKKLQYYKIGGIILMIPIMLLFIFVIGKIGIIGLIILIGLPGALFSYLK